MSMFLSLIPTWVIGAVAGIVLLALAAAAVAMPLYARAAWSFATTPAGALCILAVAMWVSHMWAYRSGLLEGGAVTKARMESAFEAERGRIEKVQSRIAAGIESDQSSLTTATQAAMQGARQRLQDGTDGAPTTNKDVQGHTARCGLPHDLSRRLRERPSLDGGRPRG